VEGHWRAVGAGTPASSDGGLLTLGLGSVLLKVHLVVAMDACTAAKATSSSRQSEPTKHGGHNSGVQHVLLIKVGPIRCQHALCAQM
jgi:hypothetical protein